MCLPLTMTTITTGNTGAQRVPTVPPAVIASRFTVTPARSATIRQESTRVTSYFRSTLKDAHEAFRRALGQRDMRRLADLLPQIAEFADAAWRVPCLYGSSVLGGWRSLVATIRKVLQFLAGMVPTLRMHRAPSGLPIWSDEPRELPADTRTLTTLTTTLTAAPAAPPRPVVAALA